MAIRTLQIPATCPSEPKERRQCGRCLRERLLVTPGIRNATLRDDNASGNGNGDSGSGTATLELEYDPRLMPLSELDAEIRRAGICCQAQRAQIVLGIDGMISPRYEHVIEAALAKLPGVVASASFASRSLRVEFDRTQCALPEIV